jgi:hypothetical protein
MLHGRVRPFSRTRAGSTGPQYDFTTGSLPAGVTFTRASSAWGFNSAGVVTQYATDVPRFVYDPVTLQNLGLLVEGARTNSIRNNTAVGTVAGTPGTNPTNWILATTANNITRTIVGSGVEDGIEYLEVQYTGTPSTSSSMSFFFDATTQVAAVTGQVWSGSCYIRLVSGSWANTSAVTIQLAERNSGGSGLGFTTAPMLATNAPLRTQRFTATRTFDQATTAAATVSLSIGYTIALPIDFTLRIGLPQLEQSEGQTSSIKTSTVAVTRQNDFALITDARVLTDQCYVVRGRAAPYLAGAGNAQVMMQVDNGGSTQRQAMSRDSTGSAVPTVVPGVVNINAGAIANGADFASAMRFAQDNYAQSLNGGVVATDTVGTAPIGLAVARIGRPSGTGSTFVWNSTIKSIETRATATDAELQALST